MKYLLLTGRIIYSLIFIAGGAGHFTKGPVDYAAANGVPMANVMVPLSGLIAIVAGLSILTGYKAKWGAWLAVIFMIPVTFMLHNFWAFTDPQAAQIHQVMFLKNLSITGGALIIAYFGTGPLSLSGKQ